jgi:uncharacterized protein
MTRSLLLAIVLATSPVLSAEGPSFDCGKAEASAEKLICEDKQLSRLDRLVAARFAAAVAAARDLDTGATKAEADLRATQRGWISGRNECWKADDPGSCIESAYLRRNAKLVAFWMLEEPTATVAWQCNGNPANEVVTYFFDTELPGVRFERGDTVDTGALVRTGSGAKYEGSFGRSIWTKGDAATYREADPDGTTYQCTRRPQG